ncbi:MAG: hypothetical protein FWC77_00900 [Defluviitaleaceae bacterium]|nr:hypothetical protein [Defluviitaleaceae bacterium]
MKRRYLFLVAAIIALLALAACGRGNGEETTGDQNGGNQEQAAETPTPADDNQAADPAPPEERPTVVLVINVENGQDDTNAMWKYQAVLEMEDILGINLELRSQTTDQDLLMITAGEIPDIFQARNEFMTQLILGGHITPMDDLVGRYAPHLAADPLRLDFLRTFQSEGTGRLYGISHGAGGGGNMHQPQTQHFIRWDLYSQLGYPEINSLNDMIDVLAAMVELEPVNMHGAPTFAIGAWVDWGTFPFVAIGYQGVVGTEISPVLMLHQDGRYIHTYTYINSNIWGNLRTFNRADQLGVFDRDSLVQGHAEWAAKAHTGQYMTLPFSWEIGPFNEHMREIHGLDTLIGHAFMPHEDMWVFANMNSPFGNTDYLWTIGANSTVQDAAMRFIDYINSPEGVRQLMSGTEGTTIEIFNGRPEIRMDLLSDEPGTPSLEGLLWNNSNMVGLSPSNPHPADGHPLSLFLTPRAFSLQNTHLDTVAAAHFGAEYPFGVAQIRIDQGRAFDYIGFNNTLVAAVESPPMNIQRIDDLLAEIIWRAIPEAITAPSDEAFLEVFERTVAELEAAGHAESVAWWTQAYQDAAASLGDFAR